MKKLWLLSLGFCGMIQGAVEYDLQKGIDLTALTSVTASQLNQLVDRGTVTTNKGMVYFGSSAPDVASNARYSRFIWLDSTSLPPTPKTYSNGTWYATSVADGAIITAKLADSAVTAVKLAPNSVTSAKIEANAVINAGIADGAVTSNKLGALSIGTAHIQAQAVTAAKILDYTITSTQIAVATISNNQIATGGVVNSNLAVNAVSGDKIALNAITSTNIATGGVAITNLAAASTTNLVIRSGTSSTTPVWGEIAKVYREDILFPNVTAGALTSAAHGLGGSPDFAKIVLVCQGNAAAHLYTIGDEIEVSSVMQQVADAHQAFAPSYNAAGTTATVTYELNSGIVMRIKSTGIALGMTATDFTNDFKLRIVVSRLQY